MTTHNLFGSPDEQAALTDVVQRSPREVVEDALTPTILLSLLACPSLIGLSIAYCTQ